MELIYIAWIMVRVYVVLEADWSEGKFTVLKYIVTNESLKCF